MQTAEQKQDAPEEPSALPIRGPIPNTATRLHKRNVFLFISALAVILGYATLSGLSNPSTDGPEALKTLRPASPGEAVKNLPGDYSKIKRSPKLGPPLTGDLGEAQIKTKNIPEPTELEKYLAQLRLERMKKQLAARDSDITFASLKRSDMPSSTEANNSSYGSALGGRSDATTTSSTTARDDDNRQDDKRDFLSSKRENDEVLPARLKHPVSKYEVMAGTLIPALLLTGINSDLPGQILGQVSQNVFDTVTGNHLLIPQGTKLLGEYDSRIAYGQERVLVVWTRLVFPNGASISLEGMPGVDLSGYAGLTDQVNNHYARLLTGVIFTSLLGAAAQTAHGSNRLEPDFSELAIQGGADNLNQAGQQITRKNLQIQPTLEIRPAFRVNVFVNKDIVLIPYKQ